MVVRRLARLATIGQIKDEVAALHARQAVEVAAFIDERMELDRLTGLGSAPGTHRSMVAEVAIAAGVSVISAQSLMSDAYELVSHNPATMARLRAGQLQLPAARAIVNETRLINDDALPGAG